MSANPPAGCVPGYVNGWLGAASQLLIRRPSLRQCDETVTVTWILSESLLGHGGSFRHLSDEYEALRILGSQPRSHGQ